MIDGKHLIATRESRESDAFFQGIDPRDGRELLGDFADATLEEVDSAMREARGAFREYRRRSAADRAAFLEMIAEEIESAAEEIVARAGAETGLPEARLIAEKGRTIGQLRSFSTLLRQANPHLASFDPGEPDRSPLPKPEIRRGFVALGPVVVFGASNFPLAFSVAGGDTASALAAGCPVVVKAHPHHPGTSELVGRAIVAAVKRAGMPEGVFSLLQGREHATGGALVRHPETRAVGFTGSQAGGRALYDLAAARPDPIPVFAELGSVNPYFVLPGLIEDDAAGEAFAEAYFGSLTMGVGQFCTNPGLLVGLASSGWATVSRELARRAGEGAAGTMLHAGIAASYATGLERLRVAGAESLAQGGVEDAASAKSAVFRVPAASFLADHAFQEEVFGPAALLVTCRDAEEMVAVAEALDGQLTATVAGDLSETAVAEDRRLASRLVPILEERVGRLLFRGFPTGVEVCASMQHGGPWPASTDGRVTSVGTASIERFLRPVAYQDAPPAFLPSDWLDG